jgi:hypothetical protein
MALALVDDDNRATRSPRGEQAGEATLEIIRPVTGNEHDRRLLGVTRIRTRERLRCHG